MNDQIVFLEVAKILTYTSLTFIVAMWWAPLLIKGLIWLKFWKKRSRTQSMTGEELQSTKQFYQQDEARLKIPRAGGILIWVTTLSFALFFWILLKIEPTSSLTQFLNFISRQQTFIPFGTLFFASIIGLVDDTLATMEGGGNYFAGGLQLSHRFGLVTIISVVIGFWFYARLNVTTLSFGFFDLNLLELPFVNWGAAWLIIPAVMIVMLGLWGSSMIDGFDGCAAGVFIPIIMCFAALAFSKGFYDIATFMMVLMGSTAAYLWYNIPPARFYMGDTGTMGILLTLGVVAFLIDALYVLPIAGFLLVITEGSVIIQTLSKKLFKRKIFLAAPLHHHLEAIGWARHQVTMRYWLISIMTSALGLALGLLLR